MSNPFTDFAKAILADPIGAAKTLLPKCGACGAATIAACSRCSVSICHMHGYVCVGERDALCVPCVEELRTVMVQEEE